MRLCLNRAQFATNHTNRHNKWSVARADDSLCEPPLGGRCPTPGFRIERQWRYAETPPIGDDLQRSPSQVFLGLKKRGERVFPPLGLPIRSSGSKMLGIGFVKSRNREPAYAGVSRPKEERRTQPGRPKDLLKGMRPGYVIIEKHVALFEQSVLEGRTNPTSTPAWQIWVDCVTTRRLRLHFLGN